MAEPANVVVLKDSVSNTVAKPWTRGLRRGNPGNKGGKGRIPNELKLELRKVASDPDAISAIKRIATDAEHPQCVRANAALWDVVIPKEQRHIVEGAPPPLVVVFRHE